MMGPTYVRQYEPSNLILRNKKETNGNVEVKCNHNQSGSASRTRGVSQLVEEPAQLIELFHKFCSSSTIHGTYFWTEAKGQLARIGWVVIVLLGVLLAIFIINSSFKGWKDNPVVTSVMQKSIEEIPFPAITICPMDDTRLVVVCSGKNP